MLTTIGSILPSTQNLHIPDGFLNFIVAIVCWALALTVLSMSVRRSRAKFDEKLVPLAGIIAAFIFAAQMINFPVAGGTSGHLVGATLAFIALGPWLGMLVMAAVIILQALLFQDGGLIVMGANLIVMGIVPGFVGYQIYRLTAERFPKARLALAGVAAWVGIMAAALVTSLLLTFSATVSAAVVLPTMLGIHVLIGIGEGLITAAVLSFILRTRPALLDRDAVDNGKSNWVIVGALLVFIVILFAPLASGSPDGLEWAAEQAGFLNTAQDAPFEFLADYSIPAMGESSFSTILAGLIGAAVVGSIAFVTARILRRTARSKA